MPLKFVTSILVAFIGITLALGYFGYSTSISGLITEEPVATTTEIALEEGDFPEAADVPPPPPEAEPLPPANPEKKNLELPKIVFPVLPFLTPAPPPPAPTQTSAPTPEEPETEYVGAARSFAQGALVNIICSPKQSLLKKSISGTGVIIDSRGIILTVAHIGHYFLLEDYPSEGNADCIIRTGSPAKNAYEAKLIYVSPEWVEENAGALGEARPRGNGENDFAFLAITESITGQKLPGSFTAVPLSSDAPDEDDRVAIGSYGAEFLSGKEIQSALYPTIDDGNIADVYTYGTSDVDVISVRGSDAAQSGSSGGGVVNTDGRFVGLISTSSLTGGTAQRTLYAITPSHIRASFKADTGKTLDSYLKGNLSALVANFEEDTEELAELVWETLF